MNEKINNKLLNLEKTLMIYEHIKKYVETMQIVLKELKIKNQK